MIWPTSFAGSPIAVPAAAAPESATIRGVDRAGLEAACSYCTTAEWLFETDSPEMSLLTSGRMSPDSSSLAGAELSELRAAESPLSRAAETATPQTRHA